MTSKGCRDAVSVMLPRELMYAEVLASLDRRRRQAVDAGIRLRRAETNTTLNTHVHSQSQEPASGSCATESPYTHDGVRMG